EERGENNLRVLQPCGALGASGRADPCLRDGVDRGDQQHSAGRGEAEVGAHHGSLGGRASGRGHQEDPYRLFGQLALRLEAGRRTRAEDGTMKELVVAVKTRETPGKNNSRRLRHAGLIPAIVYGARKDAIPVVVSPGDLLQIIHSESGVNTIFQVDLPGAERKPHVMIREYQVDPVKGRLLHADLVRIQMDEVIEVEVPIQIAGEAAGVKLDGGILEHVTRELRVSGLAGDIPEHITIDVTPLKIGDNLRASDLPKSSAYRILTDPEQILVVV